MLNSVLNVAGAAAAGLFAVCVCTVAAAQEPAAKADGGLSGKDQAIAPIAAFTARGDMPKLREALAAGLDAGLTVNEIKEILVQMYAYAGFPRSLNALNAFSALLDERRAAGMQDIAGREASLLPMSVDKNELGGRNRSVITGRPEPETPAGYAAFAPVVDQFLKEHLFGAIFARDVLTFQQREIATVGALASLDGTAAQLRSHLNGALNTGLTEAQVRQVIAVIGDKVGAREGADAGAILDGIRKVEKAWDKTFPRSDKVTVESVRFKNRIGVVVAGDLYFPKDLDKDKRHAALVVGHPFGGVKEQTSGYHAQKMAEQGFVALAFDASFYGESGGTPRYIEVPEIRVEDYSAAVDFMSNHPMVDAGRIGVIGICGGGGYSVTAAQIDPRMKAVATVSMYDMGRARRQGLGDVLTYEQRMKTLADIGQQRTREFRGEPRRDIAAIPTALSEQDTENTREFFDYYRTKRGGHPRSTTSYSFTSLAPMMNYFAFAQIETISPRPLLFIVGERAVSAYFSEDAFNRAAEPKELYVVPGASHVDLYDRPEFMAIGKLTAFFKEHLK